MTGTVSYPHQALREAKRAKLDQAEAYLQDLRTLSVFIEDDRPSFVEEKRELGIGVRGIVGKRQAFGSTTVDSLLDVRRAVEFASRLCSSSPEDPHRLELPSDSKSKERVSGTHDPKLRDLSAEELVRTAVSVVEAAKESVKGCEVPKGMIRLQEHHALLQNSNGGEAETRSTTAYLYFTGKVTVKGTVGEGIERWLGPSLSGLDPAKIGASLAERARNTARAESFKGKFSGTVAIEGTELGHMLAVTMDLACSGEAVVKRRSPWGGKLGKKVASASFTLYDDPRREGGVLSGVQDEEGVPTRTKTLVEGGILRSYLCNTYYASRLDTLSGNGLRRGSVTAEGAYNVSATSAPSNLVVRPGKGTLEDLVSEIDKGLLVYKFGAPQPNPLSGAFGLEIRDASLIKKGEVTGSVRHGLLVGNFYEGLKHVSGIAGDVRTSALFGPGQCAYVPSMAFETFQLVGQA